ncbi:GNAT family N-acetyltransferase [Acinetobacter guerrae]|uniref:Aminoglycoside N(6')-acetyltransferase type 1 n=1 Tax=Acinetobacter guerrae TaxID=1843371 RepID=A0A3A8EWJ7_9GAMM|nr:aminoglycoside 6'-N-acetyltransferase [Acinetobacter guerrae]RKG35060.1 GNAT family N-acetyltransferase [Acinetobacter guerrae]
MYRFIEITTEYQSQWLFLRQLLWPRDDAEHWVEMHALLNKPQVYLLLALDGNIEIGFLEASIRYECVNGTKTSPVAFLEGIFVQPSHRKLGIAKALINKAEAWALEQNCKELASDTSLDNIQSQKVHLALGFQETERVVYFAKQL